MNIVSAVAFAIFVVPVISNPFKEKWMERALIPFKYCQVESGLTDSEVESLVTAVSGEFLYTPNMDIYILCRLKINDWPKKFDRAKINQRMKDKFSFTSKIGRCLPLNTDQTEAKIALDLYDCLRKQDLNLMVP